MLIRDDSNRVYEPVINGEQFIIKKEAVATGTSYIEVSFDEWDAVVGEPGYYVIANVKQQGSHLCHFTEKEEQEHLMQQCLLPIFGVKNKNGCYLVIAEGMKSALYVSVALKDKRYSIACRFDLEGDTPYEDISFRVIDLGETAEYSDMARCYRNYQIERGACVPLKERASQNEQLTYAADSIEIRIRMGWKPAPSEIKEQTIENEPEMKVACTFERVKDLIDELRQQGVDKAEICLVGWNISGHDGRWPQIFPVEPKLGGEEKLKELIAHAQKNGYQIVCHTNSMDSYRIAEDFSEDIVIKKKDGSLDCEDVGWSGGRPYHVCPQKAYEFAKRDLPKVANLGFKGLHYIDVMSVVPLRKCYDSNHPVTEADTERLYQEIGADCKKLFGGFASEGAYDFASKYLDYALYVAIRDNNIMFFDQEIPLWQLVYHGIILSNPSTVTINYPVKTPRSHMRLVEYGGRPTFYFYSKFMNNSNADWLGKEDMECGSEQDIKTAVGLIKDVYEEYKTTRHLQYEYMEKHEKITEDVYEVTYSDGTVVEVDYLNNKIKF